jgi:hypothetical protein
MVVSFRPAPISDSAVFLWYSGKTEANQRGAVMIYVQDKHCVTGRYLGYAKREGRWHRTEELQIGNEKEHHDTGCRRQRPGGRGRTTPPR